MVIDNSGRKMTPAEYLAELRKDVSAGGGANMTAISGEEHAAVLQATLEHQHAEQEHADPKPGQEPGKEGTASALPEAARGNPHLTALFARVNTLLSSGEGGFAPAAPESLEQTGLTAEEIDRLILKFLLARGSATGRQISHQVGLSFQIIEPLLRTLKEDQLIALKGASQFSDFEYGITDIGRERARRYVAECTYFGTAPVTLKDYVKSVTAQTISKAHATHDDLKRAFNDLIINQQMFDRLGPAINSGRGMFLFGEPGNGKTSIAERITECFGSTIWIPKALSVEGDIIRLYDPAVHHEVPTTTAKGLLNNHGVDSRWIHIRRPTVIAGGELTMNELEVRLNTTTNVSEAPMQLKSNCGTFVIDDFGRQRMPVDELLNRWIVPLEKRYDFLNLPSGKKIQVPFDQLIIFSTNLEPKDLVDGAFLRRIPYKIQVPDPSEAEFRQLFQILTPKCGFEMNPEALDYLIKTHYKDKQRPFRSCQPRDLLLQVRNFCLYKSLPLQMTKEAFDAAVDNYFSVL
ncbi:MAG: AAA family ATPase [Planctomycetales bacterium]